MKDFSMTLNFHGELREYRQPVVAGIINVTPDSFYRGSRTESADDIRLRAETLLTAGAEWLDIGGYSTRPGADTVEEEEEYRRLSGALEILRRDFPDVVLSVDTFRSAVARRCVEDWNVEIINDIGGGTLDNEMWATVASLKCAYILMHTRGTPSDMQNHTDYDNVTADVISELAFLLQGARAAGIADVIIDPGFGFAKTTEQNFRMLADLREFRLLGCPILAGLSRKSMIWRTLDCTPDESLNGTTALNMVALMNGASILRVHDAREAAECVKLFAALNQ